MNNKNFERNSNQAKGSGYDTLAQEVPFDPARAENMQKQRRNKIETERERIDRLKANLKYNYNDEYNTYTREQIQDEPSALTQARRRVMDAFGIKTKGSELRRDREAMSKALFEVKDEEDKIIFNRRMGAAQYSLAESVKYIIEEDKKAERSKQQEIDDFLRAKDNRVGNVYISQRVQEKIEREFNEKFTKAEYVGLLAEAGDEQVDKRQDMYKDQPVTIYDLNGLPFAGLVHAIDYKISKNPNMKDLGTETAQRLLQDPSFWDQNEQIAQKSFNSSGYNAKGNTISASYINSEHNPNTLLKGDHVFYGFDKVDPYSILNVSAGDMGTYNRIGSDHDVRYDLGASKENIIEMLENHDSNQYNEVWMRRYRENGEPKKPDYLLSFDNNIDENTLKHAAYWDVPVLNINRKFYPNISSDR